MNINKALSIYTDKYISGETIDMDYFIKNMSKSGYRRLIELIPFVHMGKYASQEIKKEGEDK